MEGWTGQKISQEQQDSPEIPLHQMNEPSQIKDDINPSDSVSNIVSHKTSKSQCSSTSSAC